MKSIKSRYSIKNISSKHYQSIQITGTGSGSTDAGIVWMPYIMAEAKVIIDYEYMRQKLRYERIEKLKKLNNVKPL